MCVFDCKVPRCGETKQRDKTDKSVERFIWELWAFTSVGAPRNIRQSLFSSLWKYSPGDCCRLGRREIKWARRLVRLRELRCIPFFRVRSPIYEIGSHIWTFTPTREAQRCDSVTPPPPPDQLFPFASWTPHLFHSQILPALRGAACGWTAVKTMNCFLWLTQCAAPISSCVSSSMIHCTC